ncbi:Sodium-dependent nutrient amino acid transporter 1 [Acromyrmex echinatior]|uniref:Transporter n=1 Tax=Acromyrmex echinatior TaxID=103372 RepID=F4WER4_ACREC|nr:Sodium-dependent nutrient amino acid transporter 1 [Acromyrmex echinatior]
MSVGLGNIWRFPFTAYENGGGAFLIPYIIILIVVGKPFYLLEMILGQFSSQSSLKIWDLAPAFRGIGIAQCITLLALTSYYCSLMALTLFYLIASFQTELPWGRCWEEWGEFCVDSIRNNYSSRTENISYSSSAELNNEQRLKFVQSHSDSSTTICHNICQGHWKIIFYRSSKKMILIIYDSEVFHERSFISLIRVME